MKKRPLTTDQLTQIIVRKYSCSDIDMFRTLETIYGFALDDQEILVAKRATWTFIYLQTQISNLNDEKLNLLGIDGAGKMRTGTQSLNQLQTAALELLRQVHGQIKNDYLTDQVKRNNIYTALGYNTYYAKARNGNAESLENLIIQFKKNLTQELSDEFILNGVSKETLDNIIAHQAPLATSARVQEMAKGTRVQDTRSKVIALNAVFDQGRAFIGNARTLLAKDPTRRHKYSFTGILKKTKQEKSTNNNENQIPPTPPTE